MMSFLQQKFFFIKFSRSFHVVFLFSVARSVMSMNEFGITNDGTVLNNQVHLNSRFLHCNMLLSGFYLNECSTTQNFTFSIPNQETNKSNECQCNNR